MNVIKRINYFNVLEKKSEKFFSMKSVKLLCKKKKKNFCRCERHPF